MANKTISELPQAQNVNNQDLFVLEQGGLAKKLTAETFITEQGIIDALAEALDGHGGISSVTLSSVSGRIRTYLITFTDQSTTTFQVLDGNTIDRIAKTSTAGSVDTYTVFMSDGTTTFFTVTNGADGTVSEAMLNDALKDKAPAITETTESSAIANFTDGADDMVMHNVVAEINPVQSGSGDPSPDNIRPISGWTGVNAYRTGKNLLPMPITSGSYPNQVTITVNDDKSFYVSKSSGNNWTSIPLATMTLKAGTYTLIENDDSSDNCSMNVYLAGTTTTVTNTRYWKRRVFTVAEDAKVDINYSRSAAADNVLTKLMLFVGDTATATDYEPYQGETVTVDWQTEAGTVYGGTIDVATGLLTVDRAMRTVSTSDSTRLFGALANCVRVGVVTSGAKAPTWNTQEELDIISNCAKTDPSPTHSSSAATADECCLYKDGSYVLAVFTVPTDSGTSASTALQYLVNNGCAYCYPLATAQTYQLTPQQIMTLLGTNNVWTDIGNVSVTYPADTKMFIEKLTIPTEDDLVANQAITSGKYFMIGNSLYLALANIASGAQITIGTNAQRVSLADALNTINS